LHIEQTLYHLKSSYNRILFITQWQFDDPLIQTYTLPYVQIIQKITSCYPYVVTTGKNIKSITVKKKGDVVSIEMPSGKRLFFLGWLLNIASLHKIIKRKKIGILHSWCTNAGMIGAILKKWNKKLILNIDSFEPHAEAMVENKTWKKSGLKFKTLFHFEKKEAITANNLIFAAPGMEKYILEKYNTTVSNYYIKPACTDLEAFSNKFSKNIELVKKYNLEDKIVCVYAGKFGGIYLEDETFEFIKNCEKIWGVDKFRFLLLSNISDGYVIQKLSTFNIQHSTLIKLFVSHKEVPQYMGLADFAICPVKPVPTKRYCTPIKNGEYWAMGLPVVITPNISVDSQIIEENKAGAILESFNENGYLKAIKKVDSILKGKSREDIYNQIRPLAEKYRNFGIAEKIYREIYPIEIS
jgi:hypothetical protein